MIIASIYGTAFVIVGALLALWSLWWIISAARTNIGEREAEVAAREAVGRGEAWADQNGSAPKPFSDAEIAELSESLAPQSPEDAGIDVRPAPPKPKGRRFRG
ncbi:MAG: hypothetical protein JHD16_07575 [Solirubrobacteraceae bacterium]|nr:hypothetical protein [Solirubrobacteraceae bacterium]